MPQTCQMGLIWIGNNLLWSTSYDYLSTVICTKILSSEWGSGEHKNEKIFIEHKMFPKHLYSEPKKNVIIKRITSIYIYLYLYLIMCVCVNELTSSPKYSKISGSLWCIFFYIVVWIYSNSYFVVKFSIQDHISFFI